MWGQKDGSIWYDGAILEWQGRELQSFQAFREYDGVEVESRELYPHFDPTVSIGVSGYFILGGTIEIGFDLDYFLSNLK